MHKFAIGFAAAFIALPAFAADKDQFTRDRTLAERRLGKEEQQHCLKAFSTRVARNVSVWPQGAFRFDDYLSRNVYESLYWRDSGRGVAFTVPVKVSDPVRGELVMTLGCFYAVTEDGIAFQQAQQITWKL